MDTIFKGKRITLSSGQLITGRDSISKTTKVSSSKVQRILKKLEIEHQIEQQTGNKNRLITISKWEEYQENEQQYEQQLNNNRTTTEQQLNTNKNVNNGNNVKNGKNFYSREKSQKPKITLETFYEKNDKHEFKDACINYMLKKGYDIEVAKLEFESFEGHWISKGEKYIDWLRALQKWVTGQYSRLSKGTHKINTGVNNNGKPTYQEELNARFAEFRAMVQ